MNAYNTYLLMEREAAELACRQPCTLSRGRYAGLA